MVACHRGGGDGGVKVTGVKEEGVGGEEGAMKSISPAPQSLANRACGGDVRAGIGAAGRREEVERLTFFPWHRSRTIGLVGREGVEMVCVRVCCGRLIEVGSSRTIVSTSWERLSIGGGVELKKEGRSRPRPGAGGLEGDEPFLYFRAP